MLKSLRFKYHVQNIGIDQSLSKNALYEHKCTENIKELYKYDGKCDDQKQFKDILEADMVSSTEGLTYDSPISSRTSTPVNKTSARK